MAETRLFALARRSAVPCFLVGLAGWLRLTRLDLVRFMEDQENFFSTVRRIIHAGDLPLLGPDIGPGIFHWGHLGPLMYYIMAVPYALSADLAWNYLFFGALSLAAVALTWRLGREFFGSETAAAVACLLHAVSPYPWFLSREVNNPSFLPPFVCLFFLALAVLAKKKRGSMAIVAAGAFASAIQFHVTAYLLAVPFALVILAVRPRLGTLARGAILAMLLLGPWIAGEAREGFSDVLRPFRALGQGAAESAPAAAVPRFNSQPLQIALVSTWFNFHEPYVARPSQRFLGWIEMGMVAVGLVLAAWRGARWLCRRGSREEGWPAVLAVLWFLLIPLALGAQGEDVFARHLIGVYPVQFLLAGLAADWFVSLDPREGGGVARAALKAIAVLVVVGIAATQARFVREYEAAIEARGSIADGIALGEKRSIVAELAGEFGLCAGEAARIHCPDTPEQNQGFPYLVDTTVPACAGDRPGPPRTEFAVFTGKGMEELPAAPGAGIEVRRHPRHVLAAYEPLLDRTSLVLDRGNEKPATLGEVLWIPARAPRLRLTGKVRPLPDGVGLAEIVLFTNACPARVAVGEAVVYQHDCDAHFRDFPWAVPYRFDLVGAPAGGDLAIELRNVDSEVRVDIYDIQM